MPRIYTKKPKKKCSVTNGTEFCDRDATAHGLCGLHWGRLDRLGTVGPVGRMTEVNEGKKCGANCQEPADTKGYCQRHYQIWRSYGDPDFPVEKRGKDGWTEEYGYIVLRRPGTRIKIRAHRLFGEKLLGRELLPTETVHHRNTIRHDNSIGPCFTKTVCDCGPGEFHNLQLRDTHQERGGSVGDIVQYYKLYVANHSTKEDLVKYAMEILQQYDTEKV